MKTKTFWLARDKMNEWKDDKIWLYSKKPKNYNEYPEAWAAEFCVMDFCEEGFKKISGITIKPGECRKFRLVEVE